MKKFSLLLAVLIMPAFLAACTNSQSASSSYNGASLDGKVIKNRKFRNEAASSSIYSQSELSTRKTKSVIKKTKKKKKTVRKKSRKSTKSARAPKKYSGKANRKGLRRLIHKHARKNGVPLRLAMAVVQVESAYRVNARGAAGEVGLMQLMPGTARMIGYKGKMRDLYDPNLNLHYGMKYLGKAYRLGGRTPCGAVLKYNAGWGAKRMNPISAKYCKRVKRLMKKNRRST